MPEKKKFEVPEDVMSDLAPKKEETIIVNVANTEKLYVRSKASKDSAPVTVVSEKEALLVDDSYKNKTWLKVTTMNGENGFVMKEFTK